ncbi:hypothetical protein E2F46_02135 [Luteimonas aestuarii]|uniref:GspL cytoplasmic actin-ATPase-like domain-containing protein n=1 Tax=Luteimonas aestuarii TaxID=453837 RepID=A0A4R5U4M3_9GAMM|nr:type II secretion system protein GspL [Luteimonas aestuarii]TDK28686.1 hypothetical protein E2F46_02135 [Luteimonas aestuarii]
MRLVLLPNDPTGDALCLHIGADGSLLERRLLRADAASAGPRLRARVVVPGTEVRALWRTLPSRRADQAMAAARLALEDHVAGDLAAMHVALDPAADPAMPRCVLATTHASMQGWLAQCERLGITPEALLPDYLLLPPPDHDEALHVVHWQGEVLARGRTQAFRVEATLLAVVADADAMHALDATTTAEAIFARHAVAASPDLLQGPYARRDGPRTRLRRRVRVLAALALLSPALVDGALALRHAVAAQLLQSKATAVLATHGAGGSDSPDPATAAAALLSRTTWPDALASRMDLLSQAISHAPGARLDALTLERAAPALAGVQHPDSATLDAIRTRLGDSGLDAVVVDTQALGDGLRSELSLEVRP